MDSSLNHTLQESLFNCGSERIIASAVVKNIANKKSRKTILCLCVTDDTPVMVSIKIIRQNMDKVDSFIRKEHFPFRELRLVDGINPRKQSSEFILMVYDRQFHLQCENAEAKEFFIKQLYKLSEKYLPIQKPDFVNISLPVDELIFNPQCSNSFEPNYAEAEEMTNDYKPISAKEEEDFHRLLAMTELTIGQAKQFAAVLNDQLASLDGTNIATIMGSEQQINELIASIDSALDQADCIEKKLDEYDAILSVVRDSAELIEEKETLRQIELSNFNKLQSELDAFISLIDDVITDEHIEALQNANLSDPVGITQCSRAAGVLNLFLAKKTDISSMKAYQEKQDSINKVANEFIDRLFSYLTALFTNMESLLEPQNLGEIIIQKQTQRHRALLPYSELIDWLRQNRNKIYLNVIDRYKIEAKKLYSNEFNRFFGELATRATNLGNNRNRLQSPNDLDLYLKSYNELLETGVAESRSIVESEQKFILRFFHITSDLIAQLELQSISSGESSGNTIGMSERQFNEQIKAALAPIFSTLPEHVQKFVEHCSSHHSFIIITLYATLCQRLSFYHDVSSYFSLLYGSFLVGVKRLFDEKMQFIENKFARIKLSKRGRVGILFTIEEFYTLAKTSDSIFGKSQRRGDLDKWLQKLCDAIVNGINSISESSLSKYPSQVVRFENFHKFYSILSELKLECLDSMRKSIKQLYQENLDLYVRENIGRPFDKIQTFFEQLEHRKNEAGPRFKDVLYEPQFSRSELRRVINTHPAKEVKRGLVELFKKIEKHLSPQSPLLEVVWRNMQDELLKQIKRWNELIRDYYPSGPELDQVTIDDILRFFSEIAQQH